MPPRDPRGGMTAFKAPERSVEPSGRNPYTTTPRGSYSFDTVKLYVR